MNLGKQLYAMFVLCRMSLQHLSLALIANRLLSSLQTSVVQLLNLLIGIYQSVLIFKDVKLTWHSSKTGRLLHLINFQIHVLHVYPTIMIIFQGST